MDSKALKERLAAGGTVFGTMLDFMVNPQWAQVMAASTVDYAIVDCEHGSRDRSHMASLSMMLKFAGVAPFMRIAAPDPTLVAMALDAGADGVLVPYCERVEDVRACVAAAKLHPFKGEYLQRAIDTGVFPSRKSEKYLKDLHEDHLIIIGIESEPAVNRLDAILDVGNIDGLFIGPNDMTTSLGVPDELEHESYTEVLRTVVSKAESRGVPVMIHHDEPEDSLRAVRLGARFVLHTYDGGIMARAYRNEFARLREEVTAIRGETFEVDGGGGVQTV